MKPLLTMHNPAVARQFYLDGYWRSDTFYSLLRHHATVQPRAWALRDANHRLSYAALLSAVDALATDLHQAGLVAGDRVSIWLPNSVESVIIFLACARNGYVANTSLHQNYTVGEVKRLMTRLNTAALFCKPGYGADANQRDILVEAKDLSALKSLYSFTNEVSGLRYVPVWSSTPESHRSKPPEWDTNPDKVTYLAFTSGTTGEPKGVMHSDNTLLANGRALVEDWRLGPDAVIYSMSPLSHHIATVAISQMMVSGAELVVNDIPTGLDTLDNIRKTEATYVLGVPTHAMDLLAQLQERGGSLAKLKTFYMAGSAIPTEIAQAFLDIGIKPQNVYGMTENGSHQYTLPVDTLETIVASCGRAAKGYEVAIWDENNPDRRLGVGEPGEIGSRGALLMLGYFDNQLATESSFNASGWFLSGDIGWLDEGGNLHFARRKKDLIIRGGHNIHPTTIEELALRHPLLNAVAAVPVPDPRLGEKVCLAVHAKQAVDPYEVLEHLHREGLSKYDMPEYFVALDKFPMTPSGKVLKREITERVAQGSIQPSPIRWAGQRIVEEVSNGD